MGGVRLNRHNLLGNILREEDLALLNDAAAGVEGAVLGDVPVCVDLGVDVEGSLDIEPWEGGAKRGDTVGVGWPHAAKEGGVGVGEEGEVLDAVVGGVRWCLRPFA